MGMRRVAAASIIIAAGVVIASSGTSARMMSACSPESFAAFEREYAAAQNAFQQGKPEAIEAAWSHGADVTLMGAFGGHEEGWDLVGARLLFIAARNSASRHDRDRVVSRVVGSDLAMWVQLEHINNPAGEPPTDLRVTHVARCEGSAWHLVHRHADPLMDTRIPSR